MPNRYVTGSADSAWFRDGRIWEELIRRSDEIVIHKPSYGAFCDTPVDTILGSNLFGGDVICHDDPVLHEGELKVLRKGFARVMTLAEIVVNMQTPRVPFPS